MIGDRYNSLLCAISDRQSKLKNMRTLKRIEPAHIEYIERELKHLDEWYKEIVEQKVSQGIKN